MIANLCKSVQYYRRFTRMLVTNAKLEPANQNTLDWDNAKPYSKIPGPGVLESISFDNLRRKYGDFVKVKGMLGKADVVFLFKPEDFATIYRAMGVWPVRHGTEPFTYYQKHVRPDVFNGTGSLLSDNGKKWHNIRTLVNPIIMQPNVTKVYTSRSDEISKEFIEIIRRLRDNNLETPANFDDHVNRWSLEMIVCFMLDTRLKIMDDPLIDENAKTIIQAIHGAAKLMHQVNLQLYSWPFNKTDAFKKLIASWEAIFCSVMSYVEQAIEKFEQHPTIDKENEVVLEKMMKINKQIAKVTAFEMIIAGVDTTSSAVIAILYCLARNPTKQEKLRQEVVKIIPEKTSPLTKDNMKNLPYLRAVIKEGLRLHPIFSYIPRVADQDSIIQGYQVPKGTNLLIPHGLVSKNDQHFPRSLEFLPERWLRNNQGKACPMAKDANPFVCLPFGFGARSCVGRRFAELEIEVLIARMVREFTIEWHHAPLRFKTQVIDVPMGDIRFRLKDVVY